MGRASIVIPVWNQVEATLRCLEALVANTPDDLYDVAIVDNASTDETPALLAGLGGDVRVITNEENVGYTLASNQGSAATDGEVVVFLNNDTEPQPGWLDALLDVLDRHPECGVVGSKLVYPDGRLQEAGALVFSDGSGWNFGRLGDPGAPAYASPCEVDYCSGASLAARRTFLEQVGGGYDERYAPAYYEDADLCFAARAHGWTVRYEPSSVVVHHEGVTAGTDLASGYKAHQVRNRSVFFRRWAPALARHEPPPTATGVPPMAADRAARPCGQPPAATGEVRDGPQRVLVVDPYAPVWDRAAGSLRLLRILELLREGGHEVTFLARDGRGMDRYLEHVASLGIEVLANDVARLRQLGLDVDGPDLDLPALLRRADFDVAWLGFADLAFFYLPLIRQHSPRTRIWVDSIDVHHVRERRRAAVLDDPDERAAAEKVAAMTEVRERWVHGLADGTIAITGEDASHLRAMAPDAPMRVLPTIHQVNSRRRKPVRTSDVMFVGNFNHLPNIDAAEWFCREVAPLVRLDHPDAKCRIVGARPPASVVDAAKAAGVECAGWVENLDALLASTRVSIAPLRYGSGMKGKVAEAMAAGVPVVTTSIGAEGMDLVDGEHVLVADDASSFATAIGVLLDDDERWIELAVAAQEHVRHRYTPAAVRDTIEEILHLPAPQREATLQPAPDQPPAVIGTSTGAGATAGSGDDGSGPVSPQGVVVFGMHRSGTSMLSRMLVELGLDPGPSEHLLGASPANPHGHYEPQPLMVANDHVLRNLRRYWHCPPTDPTVFAEPSYDDVRAELARRMQALLPRVGWTYKDPRLCVMWPLYAGLLTGPPTGVFLARRPGDVATSLHTRDHLSTDHGVDLWELYNRLALRTLAGLDHVAIATYDELLGDPASVLARVTGALDAAGIDHHDPEAAASTVDRSLDRSGRAGAEVPIPASAGELWEQIEELAAGTGRLRDVDPPGPDLVARIDLRAAKVEAHIEALRQGWEEPVAEPHRPLE